MCHPVDARKIVRRVYFRLVLAGHAESTTDGRRISLHAVGRPGRPGGREITQVLPKQVAESQLIPWQILQIVGEGDRNSRTTV